MNSHERTLSSLVRKINQRSPLREILCDAFVAAMALTGSRTGAFLGSGELPAHLREAGHSLDAADKLTRIPPRVLQQAMREGSASPRILAGDGNGVPACVTAALFHGDLQVGSLALAPCDKAAVESEGRLKALTDILACFAIALVRERDEAASSRPPARAPVLRPAGPPAIIGSSEAILRLRETIGRAAGSDATVLIVGETGTGKELVAKAIHFGSRRAAGPLEDLNCAAVTEHLQENELFGHEKGAYTGADDASPGCLERADGGTLFLDEIGDMPKLLQVKLLRALEERRFRRVGGGPNRGFDVRLIAAVNREPRELVHEGRMREDFHQRLNVIVIRLAPLRERLVDVPPLVEFFLEGESLKRPGQAPLCMEPGAVAFLVRYAWPGNVRELRNVIQALVALHGDDLSEAIVLGRMAPLIAKNPAVPSSLAGDSLKKRLEDFWRLQAKAYLEAAGGSCRAAAKLAGEAPETFRQRCIKLGVHSDIH